MAKQIQLFNFSGMQRDVSVSKHPAQFLYDARNIRLTARGSDTLLSVTNEKGTKDTGVEVQGLYLGHCLLNQYLVVFSRDVNAPSPDIITRIDLSKIDLTDNKDRILILYQGNLGFSASNPITAIASYENKDIQKVYWTDGKSQPRMINIVADSKHLAKFNDEYFDFVSTLRLQEDIKVRKLLGGSGQFAPGVIQYAFTYYRKYGQESSIFYTTPLLYISHKDRGASPEDKVENAFQITINHVDPNFDYLRIYSIHRSSLNATPFCRRVQDLSLADVVFTDMEKGVTGPVASSTNPFLKISERYEFLEEHTLETIFGTIKTRCYGYTKGSYPNLRMETSDGTYIWPADAGPNAVFWVTERKVTYKGEKAFWIFVSSSQTSRGQLHIDKFIPKNDSLVFVDNGYGGDTIDPTELLFKGGETIASGTIEQKDGTLFLGNLNLTRPQITGVLKSNIQALHVVSSYRNFYFLENFQTENIQNYEYSNQLTGFEDSERTNSTSCGGFKRGDIYRCGIQFQHKSGRWSDPIYLGDYEETNYPSVSNTNGSTVMQLPGFETTIGGTLAQSLLSLGYMKARALVVFPQMQDRRVICQGVASQTMFTDEQRTNNKSLYAQSSWFFRPGSNYAENASNGAIGPQSSGTLPYTRNDVNYDPETEHIRWVEIQGQFKPENKFQISSDFLTLNSPEIDFDDQLHLMDFTGSSYRKVGDVSFQHTWSDINIQTETPTTSNTGTGFVHKTFSENHNIGIVSGLFYDDFVVDDDKNDNSQDVLKQYGGEKSPVKWVVYPWHKTGSLNNDINRPATAGTQSAILKKKVISHLRYTISSLDGLSTSIPFSDAPQLFSTDEVGIVKIGNTKAYQGNVDTLLNPDEQDGLYFAYALPLITHLNISGIKTEFTDVIRCKTWYDDTKGPVLNSTGTETSTPAGRDLYIFNTSWQLWQHQDQPVGDFFTGLVTQKDAVRMKYKSAPHLVFSLSNGGSVNFNANQLPIIEILQPENENRFGGTSQDALEANRWIPCGKPVTLNTDGNTVVKYEYGDTYYQRYDCLKTYAFTPEDINQIVEIGSFMLETHVNIDGRYDRNRGQLSNINMSPRNFNLINPVYSQVDNFFTYRIMDEDFYKINTFPNQLTWTKEKLSGAEVDLWTNLTLSSTYDMDGSKGSVTSLNTWRDKIFCFQQKGISEVLFNSRVQIPTSDNNPIEITNNYKVDGYRYLSEGIGCNDQRQIKETPAAIYFIDSVGNHLYTIGEGLADISQSHNMATWSAMTVTDRLCYDEVNKDLYQINVGTSLCFSEILGQFSSFMDYGDISLVESYAQRVFTMKDSKLYAMFEGNPCEFFGTPQPYNMIFISNENPQLDKIFTNMEFRACVEGDGEYDTNTGKFTPTLPFDSLETWDEYQHGKMELKYRNGHDASVHHSSDGISHLARKFRIWRCDIPRDNQSTLVDAVGFNNFGVKFKSTIRKPHPNDRMRNTWLYLKLQKDAGTLKKPLKGAEIHDMMVTYFT